MRNRCGSEECLQFLVTIMTGLALRSLQAMTSTTFVNALLGVSRA
jgi:hypothetical protein